MYFIFEAGREAVCPRVQPLLLPGQRVPRPVFQHRDHSHIQVSQYSLFFVKEIPYHLRAFGLKFEASRKVTKIRTFILVLGV
jgi:hypothetical protein